MRGQPPNTFKDYPVINDAYAKMRPMFISMLERRDIENPDNRVSQVDLPLMEFIRSCIPDSFDPPPLGSDSKDVRGRIREILYPFLQTGRIDTKSFAEWISDSRRMTRFLDHWLANKKPFKPKGPQPKPTLKDFVEAGLLPRYARLRLRLTDETYDCSVTASGGIEIDLDQGLQKFRSPNAVLDKGLKKKNWPAWDFFYLIGGNGEETRLRDIRDRYLEIKGFAP